jgi:hypothetical protein
LAGVNRPLIFLIKDDFDDKQRIFMEFITSLPENIIQDYFPIIHQVGCDQGEDKETKPNSPQISHRYHSGQAYNLESQPGINSKIRKVLLD